MILEIGTVLRVNSESEARQAFREVRGLAGAMWQDKPPADYIIPDQDLRNYLKSYVDISWDSEKGISVRDKAWVGGKLEASIIAPHIALAQRDMEIAVAFNRRAYYRELHFFDHEVVKEGPHFDESAANYWVHRNFKQNGLKCYFPSSGDAMKGPDIWLSMSPKSLRQKDIQQLIDEGILTSINMQPNDVLLFNNRLLHTAGLGTGYRTVVTASGPR